MAYSENEIMTMLEKGSSQLYNEDIIQLIESKNDTILRKQTEIEQYKARVLNDTEYIEKIEVENRKQQAEIERLNEEKARLDNTILYDLEQVNKIVEKARAEARKELAERLKKKQFCFGTLRGEELVSRYVVDVSDIDNLVKETEEEREG